jgi:type VI secretion system protein ImpF
MNRPESDAVYKPYVLKRLTDENPETKTEQFKTAISMKDVKDDIKENINMLFNSSGHLSAQELGNYAEFDSSVLYYGVTGYCGNVSSADDRERLRQHVLKQIRDFEPRLLSESVKVELVNQSREYKTTLEFSISGTVSVAEISEELVFLSKMNVETGKTEIEPIKI